MASKASLVIEPGFEPPSNALSSAPSPPATTAATYGTRYSSEDLDRLEPLSTLATYASSASPDVELRAAISAKPDKRAVKSGAASTSGGSSALGAPDRPGAGVSTNSGVPNGSGVPNSSDVTNSSGVSGDRGDPSGHASGAPVVYAGGGSGAASSAASSAGPTSVYASGGSGGSGGTDGDDADGDDGDDGDDDKPRSRKMIIVSSVSLVVGLGIAALVFLGRANSASYYLACEPDRIIAQQGRAFPPWGESPLEGKQWAAIKIPPEAECIGLETESEDELSEQFRTALVKRASVLLTAKEVTKTEEANALLEQALLHTRSTSDTSRNARVDIQRLLGDVAYWRASLKMQDASKALLEAAKQFDAAAQQRPRHVTDAAAWAEYVRKVVGDLEAGPGGAPATFPPMPPAGVGGSERLPAPPGVALPVEPDSGSASEPAPTPPDAGIPTGGVLL